MPSSLPSASFSLHLFPLFIPDFVICSTDAAVVAVLLTAYLQDVPVTASVLCGDGAEVGVRGHLSVWNGSELKLQPLNLKEVK